MNFNNVQYYRWHYREVPPPEYKGNSGGDSSDAKNTVSEIKGLSFDEKTGKLVLTYVENGVDKTMETVISAMVSSGVESIDSVELNDKNDLILNYTQKGNSKNVTVSLDTLEDDNTWEEVK